MLELLQRKKPQDTMGLSYKLFLKVNGRYMVTSNLDTADGLVNGSLGHLRRIDYGTHVDNSSRRKPSRIWIQFINGHSGKSLRQKSAVLMNRLNIPLDWTPIVPYTAVIDRRSAASGNIEVART